MFLASVSCLSLLLIVSVRADAIMQQAIKAFADYHSVQCNILLFTYYNEFYEQGMLLDFYRAVMKNSNIPTILENIDADSKKNTAVSSAKQCNRPLRSFIMGNVAHITKYMTEEKRKINILKDLWLLFLRDDYDQELIISQMKLSFMSEVYVARQTNCGYEFWEIYRPSKNDRSRFVYYGKWNTETGLMSTQLSVPERRRDFGGAVLRYAVLKKRQNITVQDKKHIKLLEAVWHLLEKELNFTTELVVVEDNSTKHKVPNNSQNILFQTLARNEADVTMVGLLLETSNLRIVDYSKTVAQTKYRVYMKRERVNYTSWLHFFHPLTKETWSILVLTVAVFPVIILSMYSICRKYGFIGKRSSFWDLCITVHQMLCQQGGQLQQELFSVSLLYVFFNLWAFLIHAMYESAIAAHLAIEHHETPIDSLDELLKDDEYEFGVRRNSPEFDLYYKTDNVFIRELNKAVMEQNISNLPPTYLEGLQRVCSEKKYAFMASSVIVSELKSEIPCELYHLRDEAFTVSAAYVMSKHNEYLPIINQWLHMFHEVGLLSKMNVDIVGREQHDSENSQRLKSLEFRDTAFLQLLWIGGVVLSALILFAELLYSKTRRNKTVLNNKRRYHFYK